MSFVIRRTDQGGGYVAPAGSPKSYTHRRENARRYPTQVAAESERCPGNEVVVPL